MDAASSDSLEFDLIKNLTNQSVPIMMSMFMIGLGIYNILFFVSKFGYLAAAGYGSALRIEQILLLPVIGLSYIKAVFLPLP